MIISTLQDYVIKTPVLLSFLQAKLTLGRELDSLHYKFPSSSSRALSYMKNVICEDNLIDIMIHEIDVVLSLRQFQLNEDEISLFIVNFIIYLKVKTKHFTLESLLQMESSYFLLDILWQLDHYSRMRRYINNYINRPLRHEISSVLKERGLQLQSTDHILERIVKDEALLEELIYRCSSRLRLG